MSIKLNESNYIKLRNNDPAYQSMVRVTDANNIYDAKQRYIKNGTLRNDFNSQLQYFDDNKGILCDGRPINKRLFFTESIEKKVGETKTYVGNEIRYFKFKTNAILDFRDSSRIKDTYIDKTTYSSIYELKKNVDIVDGEEIISYGFNDEKTIVENKVSSYPLQRVDKLVIHELASLFIYVNGKKIPDNEIFVYTNRSATDVFIPESYLGGNIRDSISEIDDTIYIDVRQPGSEGFYYRNNKFTGNCFTIDLSDKKYEYNDKASYEVNTDNVILYINGELVRASSVIKDDNIIAIELFEDYKDADIEMYILNNLIYRNNKDDERLSVKNNYIAYFYLEEGYHDVISGPITKSAISFFYNNKKVNDDEIVQTSRYSFEYHAPKYNYNKVDKHLNPYPETSRSYYTKDSNNEYELHKTLSKFEKGIDYYTKDPADIIDESKIDFFIEDINLAIDDSKYKIYGDDYYLLNMLGVDRCVNKMKGLPSYSVFDEDRYFMDFKEVLSNNGKLFDTQEAIKKYNYYENKINIPEMRIKQAIKDRPVLIRNLLDQFKVPSKQLIVLGNDKDLVLSSVSPIENPDDKVYYKIYVNHFLIASTDYTTERLNKYDIITVDKKFLSSDVNKVELYQYDLSYREKALFKDNINKGFKSHVDEDGTYYYTKTYKLEELPFGFEFLLDDMCAIERVQKNWYDSRDDEYYLIYPSKENIGYRITKEFEITNINADEMSIKIKLFEPENTKGDFFIMYKQYNIVESILFENNDDSYMIDNDLLIPVYSNYIEYSVNDDGKKIITGVDKYIPYINNSEPIITRNGHELIFGKDYTFVNPETNNGVACSYIVFKNQTTVGDNITCQFNSTKTNILIVGYDDLNIDNKYGLIYLSELKYPISTEYMNIFINGAKMSNLDIDILSDKLIRVHNVNRPIKTILITTNIIYKESEIEDYLSLYKESEFEKVVEDIFWNCDPSKKVDANKPSIDYTYKVNPFYKDFVGDDESKYDNHYYNEYINDIKSNKNKYNSFSEFELEFTKPEPIEFETKEEELDYLNHLEAWKNAKKFFDVYKINHGFVEDVDSVKQIENKFADGEVKTYVTDTLEIMYLNWLSNSGKTRTYGFKDKDIDPIVLKYFSVFENTIVGNRIDVVVDSSRFYEGLQPDVNNEPIKYNESDPFKPIYVYPGAQIDLKRRYFYKILVDVLKKQKLGEEYHILNDGNDVDQDIVKAICNHPNTTRLYPGDFPLEPDTNGIKWSGSNDDIVSFENPIDE